MREWLGRALDRPGLDDLRRALRLRKEAFNPSKRVLDIGCGDTKRGTVGLDLDPEVEGVDVIADAKALPFGDDTFDAVVCYHLIEHMYVIDTDRLMYEIHRVLKPDGSAHMLIDRDLSIDRLMAKDPTHRMRYSTNTLAGLAYKYFNVDVFQSHDFIGNVRRHPLTWWRYVPRGVKVYIEGRPKVLY